MLNGEYRHLFLSAANSSYAVEKGKTFSQLSLAEYKKLSPLFADDVYLVTVESSVAARDVAGGTAPGRVKQALADARKMIGK